MTAGVAMTNHDTKDEYVQANIYILGETRAVVSPKLKSADSAAPSSEN
jgi:hypothetical protein